MWEYCANILHDIANTHTNIHILFNQSLPECRLVVLRGEYAAGPFVVLSSSAAYLIWRTTTVAEQSVDRRIEGPASHASLTHEPHTMHLQHLDSNTCINQHMDSATYIAHILSIQHALSLKYA